MRGVNLAVAAAAVVAIVIVEEKERVAAVEAGVPS